VVIIVTIAFFKVNIFPEEFGELLFFGLLKVPVQFFAVIIFWLPLFYNYNNYEKIESN